MMAWINVYVVVPIKSICIRKEDMLKSNGIFKLKVNGRYKRNNMLLNLCTDSPFFHVKKQRLMWVFLVYLCSSCEFRQSLLYVLGGIRLIRQPKCPSLCLSCRGIKTHYEVEFRQRGKNNMLIAAAHRILPEYTISFFFQINFVYMTNFMQRQSLVLIVLILWSVSPKFDVLNMRAHTINFSSTPSIFKIMMTRLVQL